MCFRNPQHSKHKVLTVKNRANFVNWTSEPAYSVYDTAVKALGTRAYSTILNCASNET